MKLNVLFKKLLQRSWHQSSRGVCEGMGLGKDSGASAGVNSRGACFLSTAGMVSVDVNLGEYNSTCSLVLHMSSGSRWL